MANDFTAGGFLGRWIFSAALVFGTYNPSSYSLVGWVMDDDFVIGPVPAIVSLILLIAWIVFLRATFLSMGWLGIILGGALSAAFLWLLVDLGVLSLDKPHMIAWLVLLVLSLILAAGLSWSHIRRRLTGQVDVDDMED